MEGTDAPRWGSGLPLAKVNPYPTHFTALFPISRTPSGIATTNFLTTARLALLPTAHLRQPAWTRVLVQSQFPRSFNGLIMKRVGLCTPKPASTDFVTPKPEKVAVPEKDADADRYPRLRTLEYEVTEGSIDFEGVPLSRAAMAHAVMAAITDVSNNFMITSSDTSLAEKKEYRQGRRVQVAPLKRRFDYAETGRSAPGNKLTNYTDLVPILWRALQNGQERVDMKTASFAQASQLLHEFRRNPRRHLAANGAPDLSDITDVAEPESPTIVRAPMITAESRSPQKRIARLTCALKNGYRRLNDNIVKLEPVSAKPKAEPSPTKSSSVPSTPLRVSPNSPVPLTTQSGVHSSPIPRVSLTAPEELSPHVATGSPGRTFKAPSYSDSSSSYMEHTSPILQSSSPVKHDRPVAPTPSRWNRPEPCTPQHLTPIPSTPKTTESLIGLVSLIAPSTPQLPPLPTTFQTPTEVSELTDFRFGGMSPSFLGMSWMNTSIQADEPQRVNKLTSRRRRRRQSEPLLRKYMKGQVRRKSTSPRKVTYQNDDTFRNDASMASFFTAVAEPSNLEAPNAKPVDEQIPTVVVQSTDTPTKDTSPNADISAPTYTTPHTESHADHSPTYDSAILNIDMRTNPDIFGSTLSTPPMSRYSSMKQLAQIAGHSVAGQAKVFVTHEYGKLLVRFKLPTEFAYMFPDSQGDNESRFTTSPSAISLSPRIRFPTLQPSKASKDFADEIMTSPEDRTINVSTFSVMTALDQTPTMTGRQFEDTPMSNTGSSGVLGQTPTMTGRQFEGSFFDKTPTITSPQLADTPMEDTSSLTDLDKTPTMTSSHFGDTPTQSITSSSHVFDRTLTLPELGITNFGPVDTPVFDRTLTIGQMGIASFGSADTPVPKRATMSPVKRTTIVHTPEASDLDSTSSAVFSHSDSSIQPLPSLRGTPKKQATPTQAVMSDDTLANSTPAQHTPVQESVPTLNDAAPTPVANVNLTPVNVSIPAPSPRPSFTPVNQTALKAMITSSPNVSDVAAAKDQATPTTVADAAATTARATDFDSPGRAYMRDFIKRSRPKRPSTTETGSPIAPPAKRQPLGVKSPNTPSPQKNKRKLDMEGNEEPSPAAKPKEPTPKRARRLKSTRQKSELEIDMNDDPATTTTEAPAQQIEEAENEEDTAEMDSAPVTRRSTRLRSLRPTTTGVKSSIPTAIKLNRSGAGRAAGAVLDSALRSEQQELVNQTRLNTRKNKGNAVYPKQVLAKFAVQSAEDSDEAEAEANTTTKDGKKIGWKTPLASFQDEKHEKIERPKEVKIASKPEAKAAPKLEPKVVAKPKATLGKSGIAKPKATSRTKRATKVAESLGMVANGTPAKPQRVTRSRTRSQA